MINRVAAVALGLGLTACVIPEVDDDLAVGEVEQSIKKCTSDFCGSNSPVIKVYGTYAFNLDGIKNAEGFSLLGMSKGSEWFQLEVRNSRIVGLDRWGATKLEKKDLIGAKIWLSLSSSMSSQFSIEITEYGEVLEVADVPKPEAIETYVLAWDEAFTALLPWGTVIPAGSTNEIPNDSGGDEPAAVCSAVQFPPAPPPPWVPAEGEWDESWPMVAGPNTTMFHSLVFEGDIIHADTKTIDPTPDPRWFNIGCARHTLAKMRLTRNTLNTAKNGWAQAQAALKMFTANYCGTTAFTVPGHPLVWTDYVGIDYKTTPNNLEARWNENGPMCLDTPRYYSRQEVDAVCGGGGGRGGFFGGRPGRGGIPQCNEPSPLLRERELITSANP